MVRTIFSLQERIHWQHLKWFSAGALAVLSIVTVVACHPAVPVLDTGQRPAETSGTISGTVRGSEGAAAIEGRIVEAINVETNERQRVTTSRGGSFTLKVKPGKYRVELTLQQSEALVRHPSLLHIKHSDLDAHANFVVETNRASRPRGAGSRRDLGLGSPIA